MERIRVIKTVGALALLLATSACADERIAITEDIATQSRNTVEQFQAAFAQGDYTKAEAVVTAFETKLNEVVDANFNGDTCILIDPELPCTSKGGEYTGSLGDGISYRMYRSQNGIVSMRKQLAGISAYRDYAQWIDYRPFTLASIKSDIIASGVRLDDRTKIALGSALTGGNTVCRLYEDLARSEFKEDEAFAKLLALFDGDAVADNRPYKIALPVATGRYNTQTNSFPNLGHQAVGQIGNYNYMLQMGDLDGNSLIQSANKLKVVPCRIGMTKEMEQALHRKLGNTQTIPRKITIRHVVRNGGSLIRQNIPVDIEQAEQIVNRFSRAKNGTMIEKRPFLAVVNYRPSNEITLQEERNGDFTMSIISTAVNISFYPHAMVRKVERGGRLMRRDVEAITFPEQWLYEGTLLPKVAPIWSKNL